LLGAAGDIEVGVGTGGRVDRVDAALGAVNVDANLDKAGRRAAQVILIVYAYVEVHQTARRSRRDPERVRAKPSAGHQS
jgi:hypothetical protein